ncbi:MAG: hypothetical protein GKR94_07255 [Gammaproteobacteria bacterium]|nr:hypothetical protein [Gammaproteobacteria bacterium]
METTTQANSPATTRQVLVLMTCTGVTFLYAMTVSIANVALPQMQGALSATAESGFLGGYHQHRRDCRCNADLDVVDGALW